MRSGIYHILGRDMSPPLTIRAAKHFACRWFAQETGTVDICAEHHFVVF
jgi:hypothetical protein